jgi:hypothetical protein
MKRLVFIALLVAAFAVSQGFSQTAARKVWMEKAEVNVRLTGWFAETEFDLTFRNDGDRADEGEFALPLPPGATVSGYALDVNGKMRDAVSVEKERARTAYETVKRRMIDPGIVEREAENIYRTKVYPIPAHGTKRLIIRYHERLAEREGGLGYRLPFGFTNNLGSFTCRVTGRGYEFVKNAGLVFSDEGGGDQLATLTDARPLGVLDLKIETPPDGIATMDSGGSPAFHLRLRKSDLPARPIPNPKSVMLLWDASGSMRGADHKETFALLQAWFAKLGNTKVRLRLVRNEIEEAGDFEVKKGDWKSLRKILEQANYDGASDFSRINVPANEADLAVWVTDGHSTLGNGMPGFGIPLALIGCGDFSHASPIVQRFALAGASVIDLAREKREQVLDKLTHQAGGLLEVAGDLTGETIVDQDPVSGSIEVFGRMGKNDSPKLSLRFGYGQEVALTREIACRTHEGTNALMERILAQRQLAKMESNPATSPRKIIEHCKKHGLVSDFTSLIVLERIEDYAEHSIVPPEPELRETYDKLVRNMASQRHADLGGLAYEWERKTAWHARGFPGPEVVILPRMKQVGIWRKAVESQFPPEQRDMKAFNTVAGWHDRAMKLVAGRDEVKTLEAYDKWMTDIRQLYDEGFKLADTQLSPPPEGREFAVSVRGLVAKPGLLKGDAKMTLKQAVAKAGGPGPLGSMDNVALYRNAGKTVYNTLSEQFKDVALFPADMIVVGTHVGQVSDGWDPFAEQPEPDNPAKDAPIRGEKDIWIAPRAQRMDVEAAHVVSVPSDASPPSFPMTPGSPSSIRHHVPKERDRLANDDPVRPQPMVDGKTTEVVEVAEIAAETFVAADMEKQLGAGKDATATYHHFRARCGGNPMFYPEATRLLAARKHEALARRALSNLVEDSADPVSSKRAYAFWLAEIGQLDEAEEVLGAIVGDDRTSLLVKRDLASLRSARGEWDAAYREAGDMLDQLPDALSGPFSGIALNEINALRKLTGDSEPRSTLAWHQGGFKANLHADVRITVTAASEACQLSLVVVEPGNLAPADELSLSAYGGRLAGACGVKEYQIRRAVPGNYKICCGVSRPTTLRIEIQTDFGRPQQKTRVLTVYADRSVPEGLTELDFPFRVP